MKIAALQMLSSTSLDRNLAEARQLIDEAAATGAELIGLPENFAFMGRKDQDKLPLAEPEGHGPVQAMLSEAARQHGLWLVAGSLALTTDEPGRVTNTLLVFDPQGQQVSRYDKIHLFRYDEQTPDGRRHYDEGVVLRAGTLPTACEVTGRDGQHWRVGLSICYDLRFPELYRRLMQPPCDLIVVPSAFTWTTGQAHWELLLRARAVENQCYVMAPAQGGLHENGRRTWGHTLVADPWGDLVALRDEEGSGFITARLDRQHLAQVRGMLPALGHRCL